jgi:hypothetical protein
MSPRNEAALYPPLEGGSKSALRGFREGAHPTVAGMSVFEKEKHIRIASGVSPFPKNASHFSTLPQGEGKESP